MLETLPSLLLWEELSQSETLKREPVISVNPAYRLDISEDTHFEKFTTGQVTFLCREHCKSEGVHDLADSVRLVSDGGKEETLQHQRNILFKGVF